MRLVLIAAVQLVLLSESYSQNVINFSKCGHVSFCFDCGDVKARYGNSLNIQSYLAKHLNPESFQSLKGQLFVEVIIFINGKACCRSITNITNGSNREIEKLKIDKVIDDMPLWTPAVDKGENQNSVVFLLLTLSEGIIRAEYKGVQISEPQNSLSK